MSDMPPVLSPKKKQFASFQEELIHKLSSQILGAQALFCPDDFGNSKEPADVAWVMNRCAILMYMTEGKKSFEKKVRHNMSQMHRWLKKWRAGKALTGATGSFRHELRFDEIDYVIGLSVVGGDDVWCEYHLDQVQHGSDNKLAVCATVTNAVVNELADTGACARDFLYLLKELSASNGRVEPSKAVNAIRTRHVVTGIALRQEFSSIQKDHDFYQNSLFHIRRLANWMRSHPDAGTISLIGADLKAADIFGSDQPLRRWRVKSRNQVNMGIYAF